MCHVSDDIIRYVLNMIKIKKFKLPIFEEDFKNMTSVGKISLVLLSEPRHSKGTTIEITMGKQARILQEPGIILNVSFIDTDTE